jgi:hypothetical protein
MPIPPQLMITKTHNPPLIESHPASPCHLTTKLEWIFGIAGAAAHLLEATNATEIIGF